MKKFISIILSVIMSMSVLSLFGCKNNDEGANSNNVQVTNETDAIAQVANETDGINISTIFKGITQVPTYYTKTMAFLREYNIIPPEDDTTTSTLTEIQNKLDSLGKQLSSVSLKLDGAISILQDMQANEIVKERGEEARRYLDTWESFQDAFSNVENKGTPVEILNTYQNNMNDYIITWWDAHYSYRWDANDFNPDRVRPISAPGIDNSVIVAAFNLEDDGTSLVPAYESRLNYKDCDYYIVLDSGFILREQWFNVNIWYGSLMHQVYEFLEHVTTDNPYVLEVKGFDLDNLSDIEKDAIVNTATEMLGWRLSDAMLYNSQKNSSEWYVGRSLSKYNVFLETLFKEGNGIDAFINAQFLSHIFEFEMYTYNDDGSKDERIFDIFFDEISMEIEQYATILEFLINNCSVVSNESIETFYNNTKNAITKIEVLRNAVYTGYDNYCYVTGTPIYMGTVDMQMESVVEIKEAISLHNGFDDKKDYKKFSYTIERNLDGFSSCLGDQAARVILTMLRPQINATNSNDMQSDLNKYFIDDHNCFKKADVQSIYKTIVNLSDDPITSIDVDDLTAVIPVKVNGDITFDESKTTYSSVVSSLESKYIFNNKKIVGSCIDSNGSVTSNETLLFSALYAKPNTGSFIAPGPCRVAVFVGPNGQSGFKYDKSLVTVSTYSKYIYVSPSVQKQYTAGINDITVTDSASYNMLYQGKIDKSHYYSSEMLKTLNKQPTYYEDNAANIEVLEPLHGNLGNSDNSKIWIPIVVGVSCLAVGFITATLIFKKKGKNER